MDAVKFIKERDRMCRFYHHAGDCYQCPAKDCECSALEGMVDDDNIVTIVEEWFAAHPRKMRQSVFLEQYPEARIGDNGVMSKAVMLSIRPKWCEKIISGEKTIEVRKNRPKLETPFKVYIYCTSGRPDLNIPISPERLMQDYLDTGSMQSLNCPLGNGKVIGEFVCDKIDVIQRMGIPANFDYCYLSLNEWGNDDIEIEILDIMGSCIQKERLNSYAGKTPVLYAWHISDLKIYDRPKELNEFWFPPELYCEKERCGSCPYDQVPDVNGEYSFDCEWKRPLTRPPQSWCYVEEG